MQPHNQATYKTKQPTTARFLPPQAAQIKTMSAQAQASLGAFWTADRLQGTARMLIGRLLLTGRDLEDWRNSAEDFHHAWVATNATGDSTKMT